MHSYKTSHPYHGLIFIVFGHKTYFASKLISISSVPLQFCWLSGTLSNDLLYLPKNVGIVATVELDKSIANTCIFIVVIRKVSYGQEPYPVILLLINKNTKIKLLLCYFISRSGHLSEDEIQ